MAVSDVPVTINRTLRRGRGGGWTARIVGWGRTPGGSYGSLWSRELPLSDTPDRATPRDVLLVLAADLSRQLGH